MKGKDFSMEKTTRLKRDLAYTGTILKIYRDTVCLLYTSDAADEL